MIKNYTIQLDGKPGSQIKNMIALFVAKRNALDVTITMKPGNT